MDNIWMRLWVSTPKKTILNKDDSANKDFSCQKALQTLL